MRPAEEKVLAALGKDFEDFILSQAKPIGHTLIEIANKEGLESQYLPYLFYVLFERKPDWPRMSKQDIGAVVTLLKIMTDAVEVPRYRSGIQLPDMTNERALDKTIQKFALWGRSRFAATLLQEYMRLLKRYSRDWAKASPATPPKKALAVLKYIFEDSIGASSIYTYTTLLSYVIKKILS